MILVCRKCGSTEFEFQRTTSEVKRIDGLLRTVHLNQEVTCPCCQSTDFQRVGSFERQAKRQFYIDMQIENEKEFNK